MTKDPDYDAKLVMELSNFQQLANVHDLPPICHYWSNKYLLPKIVRLGFNSLEDFFLHYIRTSADREPNRRISIVSLGSGNCDFEVDLATKLIASGVTNFRFTCLEVNSAMLDRGRELAEKRACASAFAFEVSDLNTWAAGERIDIALAIHSLHHVVELEHLFDQIANSLTPEGGFLVHDMIGRNGHQLWSEAEEVVKRYWAELPRRCKFNHQHKRFDDEFVNWDCSTEGFEGVRAQDILPELIKRFRFEVFLGFSNVIDVFIGRSFGHNFNPESRADCEFIDRVAREDDRLIETGVLKPTHTLAALRHRVTGSRFYKDLTPEACVRWP